MWGMYSGERKECMWVFLVNHPVDFAQLKYQLEIHSSKEYVQINYARKEKTELRKCKLSGLEFLEFLRNGWIVAKFSGIRVLYNPITLQFRS